MRLSWNKIIFDDLNRWPFFAVVFLIAAAYFFSIFDLAFISQGNLWRYGHGDPGQHLVGYLHYVQDEWRFPLFHTQSLGYPHGTNIIFTDSIPLLALIFKILAPIVPDGFHPFGLWIFVCFLLLAHAFGSLLYNFGHRGPLAAVASALFAVLTPFSWCAWRSNKQPCADSFWLFMRYSCTSKSLTGKNSAALSFYLHFY